MIRKLALLFCFGVLLASSVRAADERRDLQERRSTRVPGSWWYRAAKARSRL